MGEEVHVREPGSVAEYRAGLAVIAEAWRAAFAEVVSPDAIDRVAALTESDDLSDQFREATDRDDGFVLVAASDEGVVASTLVTWDVADTKPFVDERAAEIRSLYVHPEHWGQGIGTALLDAIERHVPDEIERIVLETLRDVAPTRAFYETRGFERAGETAFEIGDETYPTVIYERER